MNHPNLFAKELTQRAHRKGQAIWVGFKFSVSHRDTELVVIEEDNFMPDYVPQLCITIIAPYTSDLVGTPNEEKYKNGFYFTKGELRKLMSPIPAKLITDEEEEEMLYIPPATRGGLLTISFAKNVDEVYQKMHANFIRCTILAVERLKQTALRENKYHLGADILFSRGIVYDVSPNIFLPALTPDGKNTKITPELAEFLFAKEQVNFKLHIEEAPMRITWMDTGNVEKEILSRILTILKEEE